MKLLIGNTGLVGTTILESEHFDYVFNSKNIDTFTNIAQDGDELFLTCLPATKWLVNKNLQADLNNINNIINIISQKHYSKVTLISTIDVYGDNKLYEDESYDIRVNKLSYGANRYLFELMVRDLIKTDDLKIFRLPALFNKHIKKNILFDLIHNNNIDQINVNTMFQWYNLDNLAKDIRYFERPYPNRQLFNLFTEPIKTEDIVKLFDGAIDKVDNKKDWFVYDYYTNLSVDNYILNRNQVFDQIKTFINEFSTK
jgi:nucleoside-diphosphate-sugar epimerase